MWLVDLHSPSTFVAGMTDAEGLMKGGTPGGHPAGGNYMPFLDYFAPYCKTPPNCLAHLVNTLAISTHYMFYFTRQRNISGLSADRWPGGWTPDYAMSAKLCFKPAGAAGKHDFWSVLMLLAALLHDVGKTLAHRNTPFDSAQHGNKGFNLVAETLEIRPNPKKPGTKTGATTQRQDFDIFLDWLEFTPNERLQMYAALRAMILYHDRLGVWLTGESSVRPVVEALDGLKDCAGIAVLDYERLAFILWVLTLADMTASIPMGAFTAGASPHPLCVETPGTPAADTIIDAFLQSDKGREMRELLPALLYCDRAWFGLETAIDLRLLRMVRSAASRNSAVAKLWNSTPNADALALSVIRGFPAVTQPDPNLHILFANYGVWDYGLDTFGYPLFTGVAQAIINRVGAPVARISATKFNRLLQCWVRLLIIYFSGLYTRIPKNPIINLEFKNHDDPLLYISPLFP